MWVGLSLLAEKLSYKAAGGTNGVDEVAVAAARALALIVLAAPRLAEIGDGGVFAENGAACVEAAIQFRQRVSRIFLPTKLCV